MSRFKLYFSIFSLCFNFCYAQISDKRLCIDAECSKPVSNAKTLTKYFAESLYHLSFDPNEIVVIYSKSAGSKENLWGAEIKGKRGYIPKHLVRETKILGKPLLLVDTEINNVSNVPQVPAKTESVRPSKVKLNYDVIDGTTIYIQPENNVSEETQGEAIENVTETLDSSIPDFKDVISPEIDDHEDNTLEIETSKIYSDNKNEVEANEESLESKSAYENQEEKNMKLSKLDINILELKEEKLKKMVKRLEQSDEVLAEKNTMVDDIDENNKIENREEIEKKIQSSESGQPDSDEPSNLSGIFGDVLGMMMGTIDGENSAEEKKTVETIGQSEDNAEVVGSNERFEQSSTKSDISTAGTTQNIKQLEDSSETAEKQSTLDFEPTIKINNFQGNDYLEANTESKNDLENFYTPDIEDDKVKVPETNTASTAMDENNEISDEDNEILEEEMADSTGEMVIQQTSFELVENETKSYEHASANYEEKKMGEHNALFNDNSEEPSQKIRHLTEDEKVSADINSPYQYEENIDNASFLHSDSPLIKDHYIADQINTVFPPVSDQHNSENETVADINTDENVGTVLTDTDTEENHQSIEQAETFEGANHIPAVSNEINYNNPDNQENETSYTINEVEPGKYNLTTEIKHVEETSIQNVVDSDNRNEDNSKVTGIEQQENGYLEKDEFQSQEHNDKDNIKIMSESPGIFSYFGHRDAEQQEKVQSSNYDRINQQTSAELNIDASMKNDGDGDNKHEHHFKQNEIESQQHEEQKHTKVDNGDSYTQNKELGSSNHNKINSQYSDKLVNAKTNVKQEKNLTGSFIDFVDLPILNSDFFLYLITTAISVIIFLLGYFALDKHRREAPLVAKINKLEKEFLIVLKEKELLAEEIENGVQHTEYVQSPDFLNLQKQYEDTIREKQALMEEIQTLEKELENSTEVGLELNRMLSDILSSENAGALLMSNIEGLQEQLIEQQGIVSSMKEMLNLKETENHELHLELEIANKKVVELQSELDRLLLNIVKIEEEKELQERKSESEITDLKMNIDALTKKIKDNEEEYKRQINELKNNLSSSERDLQLKMKEFNGLKSSVQHLKNFKNANTLDSLLEVTSIKAELEQLKTECHGHCEKLRYEEETNAMLEKKSKVSEEEADAIKKKFDEVDKARLEVETKLQVLTNYFKDREAQFQGELMKYESMWSAKQGEATSTSERIKYLQSEVHNYKAQNESLKQEIVSQEVELKSQISVLEKKVHENWVSARQAERRLEDSKQEAAHLRNRLTLRERALQEDKIHNRIQNSQEQKVDLPVSPLHLDSPSSPPLLYNSRDHITKSPPILGMPPPFLPPPPGIPLLPPPHLPFMPPPLPDMFPGDRRPPPLGRMSSPPLNSRYSTDRRSYSPYERRSPSPSYDESEYGTSPVRHRRYSPFSNRIDHRRMGRLNGRNGDLSSGSGNSNESINGLNNSNPKV